MTIEYPIGDDIDKRIADYEAWLNSVEWVADPTWKIAREGPAELGPDETPDASGVAARLLTEGMADKELHERRPSLSFLWEDHMLGACGRYVELDGEFSAQVAHKYEPDVHSWEVTGSGLERTVYGEAESFQAAKDACDDFLRWAVRDYARQRSEAAARAKARAEAPSREIKRAAKRAERKANRRVNTHDCVIKQAAIRYGVALVVEAGAEQHRLHIAMGEPTCPACRTCRELRAAGRPPTKMSDEEVDALLDYWELKVDRARGAPEAKKRIETRKAFDATVFGGSRG